jgi:competence protein ComFC
LHGFSFIPACAGMKNKLLKMKPHFYIFKNALALKAFFYDLVFPRECVSCQTEGAWICSECFPQVRLNNELFCIKCDSASIQGRLCDDCRIGNHLNGIWVAADYSDKNLSALIKIFKYKFAQEISNDLGLILNNFLNNLIAFGQIPAIGNYLLIPVPLSRSRLAWRGFNQAEALAGIIYKQGFGLDKNFTDLKRIKYSRPQTKLNKKERIENVRNSFQWRGGKLDGKKIILVDDVVTTGSTLNECAKELKRSGAKEVWGLVIAKN